ncbi:MAG: HEAT repeat domain-containing protein [Spirochaetales bacterium]
MKKLPVLLGLLFYGLSLFAQEESLVEERRKVFRFGTETEISELLKTLQEQKDKTYIEDIVGILKGRISRRLLRRIFEYLKDMELSHLEAEAIARSLLEAPDELDAETLITLLQFLTLEGTSPYVELVKPLVKDTRRRVASTAVRYLGKKGSEEVVPALIEIFKSLEADEELRTAVLLALGELKDPSSVPFLTSILEDRDERLVYRRFAATALGNIGSLEAFPSIKKALEDSDNLLRAHAISALANYQVEEVEEILLQALRDDFARLRTFAAEGLGKRKSERATEMLIFRVRRDADRQVRLASLRALANIGTGEAISFLKELLLDERASSELRLETIRLFLALSEGKDALFSLMEQEWTKQNSRLLDELGKGLSTQTSSGYEKFFQKMLTHPSFIIRLYSIRGIGRNKIEEFKVELEKIAKEGLSAQERKEARLVLEQWNQPR